MRAIAHGLPKWAWVIWFILLGYHIATLPISPLPWFDETYFASMTLHFLETGEFFPDIGPLLERYYPQAKAYGPAYFLVTAAFFKTLGFGLIQLRLPALLFGFLFLPLAFKIMEFSGIQSRIRLLILGIMAFDTIFLQNIHSGRMDSMALLCTCFGVFHLLQGFRNERWLSFAIAGISFGLAILTTPRIAVNLLGPAVMTLMFFLWSPGQKRFGFGLLVCAGIIGMYSIWVFWGFGGFSGAYQYFFGRPKEVLYYQNLAEGYVSIRKYIPVFQYPILGIFVCFLTVGLYFRRGLDILFWIGLINLVAFYVLVKDTGIYSIFAMPWLYLCLGSLAQNFSYHKSIPRYFTAAFILILGMNFSIFIIKNTTVWLFASSRDTTKVQEQISAQIPKGSRVIGDEVYYYFVKSAGSDFQYLERGAGTDLRKAYHLNTYNFQYIVVRNPPSNVYEFEFYKRGHTFRPCGQIQMENPGAFALSLSHFLSKLRVEVPRGYQGTIYCR